MSVTTTNLLQGPSTIYRGLVGATEPADSTLNTPPSTGYADLGATLDGVDLGVYETYAMLEADQLVEHAGAVRTAREFRFGTKLAEVTLVNLAIAINEVAPTTGTSPAGPVLEPISGLNNLPIFSSFIIDGYAPGGFKRRIILRKALQTADVKMSQSKKDQTSLSVEFTTFYVSPTIRPFRIVDGIA